MPRIRYAKIAQWFLRLMGWSICLAFLPIFFPLSWMHVLHRTAGLGEAPSQPIFEYLARSTSAMYFAHGCVVLLASTDVRRYLPLIRLIAVLNIFAGAVMFGTDFSASMPLLWTLIEGPPIITGGLILLWLTRGLKKEMAGETASD
ncbi:MAG: hypothetical protein ACE361_22760 [Aureliella sp.]